MKRIFKLNFHLFEGAGGDAGGGESGVTAEASALLDGFDQGQSKKTSDSKPDLSNMQYGSEGEGSDNSQVGSDNENTETNETDIEKEFQELIGKNGKFHEIYGKQVSDVIQNRFRNQADLQGQVNGYEQAIAPLFQKYGVEAGDIEGLTEAIKGDDDLYRARAEELGLDIDQYRHNLQLEADAERGRRISQEYEQQQRRMQMFNQWENEAAELKNAFPNFDLAKEYNSNDKFVDMLDAGLSVRDAFVSTHINDILQGYGAESEKKATQNVVNDIKKQASRPVENGIKHAPAAQRKVDPSTFTDDDMDEIFKRAESGYVFRP